MAAPLRILPWLLPLAAVATVALVGGACTTRAPQPVGPPPVDHRPPPGAASTSPSSAPSRLSTAAASASASTAPAARPAPCPEDMVYVDGVYCKAWERRCIKQEQERSNRLTICHKFAEKQTCKGGKRRQRFCIDRYEYPSRKGGHPPVMVSAYDAAALCAEKGKRLCWESEWITACEGPDHLPFPYGYARDNKKCNIDRPWRKPSLKKVHNTTGAAHVRELKRLDQSVPSGSMETCKSGYGVYDLTGNLDEWALLDVRRGTSEWIGLKGGQWHHVRNACRPVTTSHAAQWSYYFVSFRCCQDPDPQALEPIAADDPGPKLYTPPPAPTPAPPHGGKVHRGWPPEPAP